MFKQSVKEALGFYVYALTDPRDNRIFYIGKGKGDRIFQHVQDSIKEKDENLKLDTIRSIHKAGLEVGYYILRHNLDEPTAYIVESTLIDLLSYDRFNKESILTNIVCGHHQWNEGIKTIHDINVLYDCEKINISDGDHLLLVSLNKTYNQSHTSRIYCRPNLYESTRKYWSISPNRLRHIDYVLGVYKGIVRAVIKPTKWKAFEFSEDGTKFKKIRYGCIGKLLEDSKYLNKDVSDFPFGSGGAVTYIPRDYKMWHR
ncbi:MAG: endonuclease [Muribaculaceae bacterium]|nr:endonuclease [Muribaculaceae bacterium]